MMAQTYRLKPRIVEAIRFFDNSQTLVEISKLVGKDVNVSYQTRKPILQIGSYDILDVDEGDYIVRHKNGEIEVMNEPYFNFHYQVQVGE